MSYADQDQFFSKFEVRYAVGPKAGEEVPGPLFTLAFARDPHARVALAAYAESVKDELPELAAQLTQALRDHPLETGSGG